VAAGADNADRFAVGDKGVGRAHANVKRSERKPAWVARLQVEPAEGVLVTRCVVIFNRKAAWTGPDWRERGGGASGAHAEADLPMTEGVRGSNVR